MKDKQIEVITYEQERLDFFTKAMQLAQKRYNRLFKIFKDDPYLSEGTTMVSDAGRESQFYHDVVEMLENGDRKQSEGEWKDQYNGKYANPIYVCSICGRGTLLTPHINELNNMEMVQALSSYCPNCGAKMKGGTEK